MFGSIGFDPVSIIKNITAVRSGKKIEGYELVDDVILMQVPEYFCDLDYAHDLHILLLEQLPPPRKMRYQVSPGRDHFHIGIVPMG